MGHSHRHWQHLADVRGRPAHSRARPARRGIAIHRGGDRVRPRLRHRECARLVRSPRGRSGHRHHLRGHTAPDASRERGAGTAEAASTSSSRSRSPSRTRNFRRRRRCTISRPNAGWSSPRRCGRATCRTWCASARSSPPGPSVRSGACSPTTPQKLPDDPAHRINALELGGGALLDLGIYPISFASGHPRRSGFHQGDGAVSARPAPTPEVATGDAAPHPARISTTLSSSRAAGPSTASIVGTKGRIDIDGAFYTATSFRHIGSDRTVIETYSSVYDGRGMQFQALAAEQHAAARATSQAMSAHRRERSAIMCALDDVRAPMPCKLPHRGPLIPATLHFWHISGGVPTRRCARNEEYMPDLEGTGQGASRSGHG